MKEMFKPGRVILALVLAPLGDPVLAQERATTGYNPAKHPRELHFMTSDLRGLKARDSSLPFLVERGRDVAELRCEEGEPVVFRRTGAQDLYYCAGSFAPLAVGGVTLRFDRAPSPSPHLRLTIGGMGVTVGCDIGTLRRLYEPKGASRKFRCIDE